MNTKHVLKGVLSLLGVLILCSLLIPAIPPAKTKGRARRIGSVNAVPLVVMSMTLSNIASPSVQNQEWGKRYADGHKVMPDLNHKP